MKKGALDHFDRNHDEELAFAEEAAIAQAALVIADLLDGTGVTQRELAERIGVTEARVSQLLNAESNPTVRTLARIGKALGRRFQIDFVDPELPTDEVKLWPCAPHLPGGRWSREEDDVQVGEAAEVDAAA